MVKQFLLAEFAANNAISVSIGFTPFYLSVGTHPSRPTSLVANGLPKATNEAMEVTLEMMKTALVGAQTNFSHAQKQMGQQ